MRIHIQAKAKQDLKNIWRYTNEQWGEKQADKYFDALSEAMNTLAERPEIGMECKDIRAGYRLYPIGKHVVFYCLMKDRVQIIRILHESMDVKRHM